MLTKIENMLRKSGDANEELWLGAMTALICAPVILLAVAALGAAIYALI